MTKIAPILAVSALLLALGCGPATKVLSPAPEPHIVLAAPQAVLDTIAAQERSLQEAVNLLGAQLDDVKLLTEADAFSEQVVLQTAPEPKVVKQIVAKGPDPLLVKIANQAQRVDDVLRQAALLTQQIQGVSEQIQSIRVGASQAAPSGATDQYGLMGLISSIVGIIGYVLGRIRKPKP